MLSILRVVLLMRGKRFSSGIKAFARNVKKTCLREQVAHREVEAPAIFGRLTTSLP